MSAILKRTPCRWHNLRLRLIQYEHLNAHPIICLLTTALKVLAPDAPLKALEIPKNRMFIYMIHKIYIPEP